MSRLTKGYMIAGIGIALWSTTGILIGWLVTRYAMDPLLLAFWRNLLVCTALFPALYLIRRSLIWIDRTQIRFYAFYGLILALFNSVWTLSVQANGAAVGTVLAYSSAGFTAVLAWWFFKEQLKLPKMAAVMLSLIGCVLVSNAYSPEIWNLNPQGITTGILSGVLFAAYNMMGKEAAKRSLNPWTSLLYSFAFGTVFTLIFNLFAVSSNAVGLLEGVLPELPVDGWLILIVLSFIPTVLGFGLYNTSMNYLPASTASLLATSEPAITAALAYIFLGEQMTIVQIIGSLFILSGVVIVRFEKNEESTFLLTAS